MAVFLSPIGNAQVVLASNALPANAGFIYTYLGGTTTPAATFTTISGLIANTNPIKLTPAGLPPFEIWLTGGTAYKFVITDALGNQIGPTYDNFYGIGDTTGGGGLINPMTAVGDIIVGGTVVSGVATPNRLGIGTTGQVLTVSGGTPAWGSSTTPPYSTYASDLLYATGTNGTTSSVFFDFPACSAASNIKTPIPGWINTFTDPGSGAVPSGQMTFSVVGSIIQFVIEGFVNPGTGVTLNAVTCKPQSNGTIGGGTVFGSEPASKSIFAVSQNTGNKSLYMFMYHYQVQNNTDSIGFNLEFNGSGTGTSGFFSQLKAMRLL